MEYFCIDWLALACGVISTYFIGNQRRCGFVFSMVGNSGWLILGIFTGSEGLVISSFISVTMYLRGWLKWRGVELADLSGSKERINQ